jgi:hypothetical protein
MLAPRFTLGVTAALALVDLAAAPALARDEFVIVVPAQGTVAPPKGR